MAHDWPFTVRSAARSGSGARGQFVKEDSLVADRELCGNFWF
jgi:hypothetical protein